MKTLEEKITEKKEYIAKHQQILNKLENKLKEDREKEFKKFSKNKISDFEKQLKKEFMENFKK